MDGPCGRWVNVRAKMPVRHGVDGRPRLFAEALPAAKNFRSPRASAFTLLGLDAYCAAVPDDRHAREIRHILADRLMLRPEIGGDAGLAVVRGKPRL